MAAALRWSLLLLVLGAVPARAFVPPEVQFCLQHLEPAERERIAKVLGPLEELPRYQVQLEVDPKASQVKGRVQVQLLARGRPLQAVFLRVTPNAFGARVKLAQAKLNGEPTVLEHPEPSLYRVPLSPAAAPGAEVTVEVSLEAQVPRGKPGSNSLLGALGAAEGAGDHGAFAATEDFLSLVGIVPLVPPLGADGQPWAGPAGMGDLALYEPSHVLANLIVPSEWKVHATGVPMGEVPLRDGRVRFTFAAGAVRDFPVFLSRGYTQATTTVGSVTVESHYAQRDAEAGQRVLRYASQALSEFQRRLGPYPYKSLRVVEAPLSGGAGGMEFPGLITVGTSLYRGVTDPAAALSGSKEMEMMQALLGAMGDDSSGMLAQLGKTLERTLEFTVAHEVAHQYFAGLVGSDPVKSPVVDEPLTQYAALLYMEWRHGRGVAEAVRREALVSAYHLYRLAGGKDGPADRPTSEFESTLEYGALVYGKAPLLHHASRQLIGDEAFLRGLRSYVDTWRFRWACTECFTQELARASPTHAKALERLRIRWWKEAHGDEDLGAPNLGALMGTLGAGAGAGAGAEGLQLDPEALKMLEELMPGLLQEQ
jgi:hypothetical protein